MAHGVKRNTTKKKQVISQVSRTDGTSLDPYYGLEHSFQYARNINADDELHGLKLSQFADYYRDTTGDSAKKLGKCQLVSIGDKGVLALPVGDGPEEPARKFDEESFATGGESLGNCRGAKNKSPGVVFQDAFWYGIWLTVGGNPVGALRTIDRQGNNRTMIPCDHPETTDASILDPTNIGARMTGPLTCILNYNNTRLIVADGPDIWVYYPELDKSNIRNTDIYDPNVTPGTTGWKKTLSFEAGVEIVGLTCTFEYLKIRCRDEGWNTKVYYYQGNNNLRDTFVYNVVDLTGQRVTRVYSINSVDYYITSTDGSDGYINLNKLIGNTPIQLLKQRAGLTKYDVNTKDPYFVGPASLDAPYQSGRYYIADAYGVFTFEYNPEGYDKGYMKWGLNNNKQVYGACINKNFLYVSDEDGCWKIRIYDTGVDGYQENGILISREYEGLEGGTLTKMLDAIQLNYEMNPLTKYNGRIDVYVSPNNLWKNTTLTQQYGTERDNYYIKKVCLLKGTGLPDDMSTYYNNDNYDGWFHVMTIDQNNAYTRTERIELLNKMGSNGAPAFGFDRQTITYAIVINRYTPPNTATSEQEEAIEATPIVRQIDIDYHTKEKINYVYDIK